MRTTATLTLVAALLSSGEANAQSLQLLTSAEVAARPAAGGRIGVEIRSGRLPKTGAFYAEVVEVKEQSSFIGRLKPGDHILGVQSYSFGNMDDMITYLGSTARFGRSGRKVAGCQRTSDWREPTVY